MELYLCSIKLGEIPLVAGAVNDTDVLTVSPDLLHTADILELRVDMFDILTPEHVEEVFRTVRGRVNKPVIATIRDVAEGGQKEIPDRALLYRSVVPLSDAVDVEVRNADLMKEVKEWCVTHRKILIGSYHNFTATPDDSALDEIVVRGKEQGADIVKIAAMPGDREEVTRLLLYTLRNRDKMLITMSMGDIGLPSRIFGPLFGSLVTYGYIGKPSAPGQLSASELLYILRRLKLRQT
ncbi:MAG: type I 3-dehydroquinate dehydratase [Alphaproteobacteria bacterium]|uniref:3-dehydroquinate dehydratase n=1 Tax=Candidatus Nitrobium versatile TaxID=2884831 RepID=A0A953SI96_9BACT|nr:type I 3-dehydroquinate dehydratase [Candidatus Nitrobium versatile]